MANRPDLDDREDMAAQKTNRDGEGRPPAADALHTGGASCLTFQRAVEFIGRRWVGAILYVLLDGPCRFNELLAKVPNISDRLLTERLRELEAAGMVTRDVQPGHPVRVGYELADAGRALTDVVQSISRWAKDWMPDGVD